MGKTSPKDHSLRDWGVLRRTNFLPNVDGCSLAQRDEKDTQKRFSAELKTYYVVQFRLSNNACGITPPVFECFRVLTHSNMIMSEHVASDTIQNISKGHVDQCRLKRASVVSEWFLSLITSIMLQARITWYFTSGVHTCGTSPGASFEVVLLVHERGKQSATP